MAENKKIRLITLAREFNVGVQSLMETLEKKGIKLESRNAILDEHSVEILRAEHGGMKIQKANISEILHKPTETVTLDDVQKNDVEEETETEIRVKTNLYTPAFHVVGKIDLTPKTKNSDKVIEEEVQDIPPKIENQPQTQQDVVEENEQPVVSIEEDTIPEVKEEVEIKTPEIIVEEDVDTTPATPVTQEEYDDVDEEFETETSQEEEDEGEIEVEAEEEYSNVESPRVAPLSKIEKLSGPKILGKMELPVQKPEEKKGKRNRIKRNKVDISQQINENRKNGGSAGGNQNNSQQGKNNNNAGGGNQSRRDKKKNKQQFKNQHVLHEEISDEEVQKQIKDTLSRLTNKGAKTKSSKYRRDKRDAIHERMAEELENEQQENKILKVTEFVSASELATMMNVTVNQVIEACMNLGLMVSINQRLDAEALAIIAEEFGFKIEFVSASIQEAIDTEEDKPEDLEPRSPVVTVMGHVDHGKTSLLDYIRKSNVIAGEAGGITQHIGAYSVKLESGRRVTFLDTPGHEAFTAMRARGAKITDVAIIIVAADDAVMPQTKEAISHAEAAGVPIVFAINKVDKPNAHPEKIKEELANMNYLVEEWGGKYQSQDISAKSGLGIEQLLEKVCLEADMLDLKANPNRKAVGSVIESSLDKGRGYVATVLVQNGTMRIGDVMLAGTYSGRVKAMFNERGKKIQEALPATPALVLGLNGAPQAGDTFNIMEDDKSAREIATKREQLQRIQGIKTQKHVTLDEIGRRIAIGNFKELNIIIKGDVDGSIEAMTDSLLKLSTEEVQVNVIHKAVGQISESDVLLAAASNAVIIGFQVRPSLAARRIAEKEEIEIRLYSIIYDAINEIKDAIEGMLAPETKEEVTCSVEVMETFKISKVGTVAGCIVREGKVTRNTMIRIIRDGIVVHTGKLGSLRRFKDDVKEVTSGQDCGLNIENYNDIKVGDYIEGYQVIEIARKL